MCGILPPNPGLFRRSADEYMLDVFFSINTVIDRTARNQAAATIRHYVCGVITNKEFEARYPYSKHDPIISALDDTLWSTYEDISKHRLIGKYAAPEWAKQRVARWLLFLYSDVEYQWPKI